MGYEAKRAKWRYTYGHRKPNIRDYQAEYFNYNLVTLDRKSAWRADRYVEHFLTRFRRLKQPFDFTMTNVADFRLEEARKGRTASAINHHIRAIYTFWEWLRNYKELPIPNIAAMPELPRPFVKTKSRSLDELKRLLEECYDPVLLKVVEGCLAGMRVWECVRESGLSYTPIYLKFKAAATRAGQPEMSLKELRRAYAAAIARRAIDYYCSKPSQTATPEAQV